MEHADDVGIDEPLLVPAGSAAARGVHGGGGGGAGPPKSTLTEEEARVAAAELLKKAKVGAGRGGAVWLWGRVGCGVG